jgi:hypothetical protein
MNSIRPVNAMLFTMLVWGIAPAFIRSLSVELGAANALVIRYTLVGIGYAAGLLIAGLPRIPTGDWPRILFVSLVGVAGYNLGSVMALHFCLPVSAASSSAPNPSSSY